MRGGFGLVGGLADGLEDGFGGLGGVDAAGEGFVLEAEEDFAAAGEGGVLFEGVGGIAAGADAGEGGIDVEVEQEEEVGPGGEGFVAAADFHGIEAAGTLVGHGGEVVAIKDDDLAGGEGGADEFFDVLLAVAEEEFEFFGGGQAAGGGGFAEFAAPGAVGGFAAGDDLAAVAGEPLGEAAGLGAFAGAIDAFEHDEKAGGRGGCGRGGRVHRAPWR